MIESSKLKIYQIYFRKEQKSFLEPHLIPYFKPEFEEPEWREYWTFKKNYRKVLSSKCLTGFVSWKFASKSGVPPEKFIRFIQQNPDFDVYFLNPFPLDSVIFSNVWHHGEYYHPGLIDFSQKLLAKAGYSIDLRNISHYPEQAGYSNYWVGNGKFWKQYMDFTKPFENYVRNNLTSAEAEYLYSIADPVSNCSHIPFIIERLFTSLLVKNKNLKSIAYSYDKDDLRKRYSKLEIHVFNYLRKEQNRKKWRGKLLIQCVLATRKMIDAFRNHRRQLLG